MTAVSARLGRRSGTRIRALLAVSLLVATACSGGDTAQPAPTTDESAVTPTVATESAGASSVASPTSAGAAIDPAMVLYEITVEYLDAVMTEFDRMEAEVYELLAETGDTRHPPMVKQYVSFVDSSWATQSLDGLEAAYGIEALASPPGVPETTAREVLDETEDCVLFTARRDLAPLLDSNTEYVDSQPHYIELVRRGPDELNPVPWKPPTTCEGVERFR